MWAINRLLNNFTAHCIMMLLYHQWGPHCESLCNCGLADLEILFHAATNHVVGLWNMTFIIQSKLWFPSIHYVLRDSSSNFGLFFHSSSCNNEVHYHKMHLSIQSIKWGWKATKQLPALDVTHQCNKDRDYFYAVPQAAILMVLDTMATLKKTKFAV